ncbi:beta-ketoacyl-[acyl-carrier-protein] synthase family protein [Kitasatospora sp. GP82]|uniref:beta-ketoacyl-[acyl-carrier-protein] synthase family protein n=1 Tax=Kitasatospora sp. GP82 TaxID=3035089 RepID=UPI00247329EC|nr:beta-ketoacyl-[acyl-carrier-protein] synthase family protein [Kitasatospora sp. GP82]MDH6129715.1 3-oxoacyl-[acyl-carrier-protein] synthase II [Kitasatospora sp. GP82]
MPGTDIAVTGLGLITPAGTGVEASWRGLLRGRSLAAPDPLLTGLPVDFSCAVPDFDADAVLGRRLSWRLDRFVHLGLAAARQAVADAGLDPDTWPSQRVAVVLGVGSNSLERYETAFRLLREDRIEDASPLSLPRSVPNMLAGEVGLDLGARGPNFTTNSACASGATAIGVARDLLRAGVCDIAITGGSESGRARGAAAFFGRMGALSQRRPPRTASRPFDADRSGFVLGEGAAVLVLERAADAAQRRAPVRAYLSGYGASADAYHFTSPHPQGLGAEAAMLTALADAGLEPDDIGHINAHGTSTVHNDVAESRALRRVFREPPPVTANKSVIGHTLGAAGAIEAAYTVLTLQHRTIPPTANLDKLDPEIDLDIVSGDPRPSSLNAAMSTSFGFGGQNAALLFRSP